MRKKVLKQVITFPSTTAAMAFESAARAVNLPGRLVPVPHTIKAGCGMCWICPIAEWQCVDTFIHLNNLAFEGVYVEMMY